jgi:aryl-alcohol dehydrogenase-like predicted oxidoreductase
MQALVLGTAQWGTPYGVTNERGRLGEADLAEIMDAAQAAGIDRVDTASGYGDAEARLAPWASGLAITTKVKANSAIPINEQTRESLDQLGVPSIRTLLIHDWFQLDSSQAAAGAEELAGLREMGLTQEIGISSYEPSDLEIALAHFDRLDAVQVPINALDGRLDNHHVLSDLHEAGTRIQARSVFLQGLLAAPSSVRLAQHPDVVGFHEACREAGFSPLAVALASVRSRGWISEVVVGATSGVELSQIAAAWQAPVPEFRGGKFSEDLSLIDPRNWA